MNDVLYKESLKVIFDNQPNGAYLACPNMPDYQFSWFRDGAYIAYALTLDGIVYSAQYGGSMAAQWESARPFHDWCAGIVNDRAEALERTIERAARGEPFDIADTLHARYQPDGQTGPDNWPEFQLDGPGTWLWSIAQFVQITGMSPLPVSWARAIDLTARYLAALWQTPCYDCWEERGDDVHISTLGAIYAGLAAAEALLPQVDFEDTKRAIHDFVMQKGLTPGGELAKSVGLDMVDANLLSVAVPHGLLAPDEPVMQATAERIERELYVPGYGLRRHLEDTYYGGGPWVLLGLWLAWYNIEAGETARARELLQEAERQADSKHHLPEQVAVHLLAPDFYDKWVGWRGPIARPLLWSHAKYLLVGRKLAGTLTNDS